MKSTPVHLEVARQTLEPPIKPNSADIAEVKKADDKFSVRVES
jgi:hypothetical protein